MNETLEQIAHKCLGVQNLETQKNDGLDFHDIAVWNLAEALKAAYAAGYDKGRVSND